MPLHFAKSKPNHEASDALMLEASAGVNQPETQQDNSTQMALASDDNNMDIEMS